MDKTTYHVWSNILLINTTLFKIIHYFDGMK